MVKLVQKYRQKLAVNCTDETGMPDALPPSGINIRGNRKAKPWRREIQRDRARSVRKMMQYL